MRSIIPAMFLVASAAPAVAMTHVASPVPGGARAVARDPDEGLSRLAAAAGRGDRGNAKPDRSFRSILKDDPNLRAAFASLDNR